MKYELQAARDILEITPNQLGNARLVTIDAENVITPYGAPELRDGTLEMMQSMIAQGGERGRYLAIATNNKSPDFVETLTGALPADIPVFSGLLFENKKRSPEMFQAAADYFNVLAEDAVHIDDQLLSHRGARQAGFLGGVLVRPYGSTKHFGVKAGRYIDTPVRWAVQARSAVTCAMTDGIDG